MGSIIAIANKKGGVGKTTTAINLAASLALENEEILVVDTDPQGNLTSGLGINSDDVGKGLYDIYAKEGRPWMRSSRRQRSPASTYFRRRSTSSEWSSNS